jgi:hypothetical protein
VIGLIRSRDDVVESTTPVASRREKRFRVFNETEDHREDPFLSLSDFVLTDDLIDNFEDLVLIDASDVAEEPERRRAKDEKPR